MDEVFPELKGSEDERIRKGLVHFILYEAGNLLDEETEHKFIAYLERQKEQKPINDSIREKIISRATSEKQVVLISESSGKAEIGWDTRSLEDAKKLLEYGLAFINENGVKPAEWSEEDEEIEKAIESVIRVYGKTQGEFIGGYDMDTLIFHLRAVFHRNNSWNDKDKNVIVDILRGLHKGILYKEAEEIADDILKSLRPSWKPSDEHPEGGYSEKPNDLLSEPDADLEKAARNMCESMNNVRRDMVELGKILNARKK